MSRLKYIFQEYHQCQIFDSNTIGCPPVRGDNPRALGAEWIILRTGGQTWYYYFIPSTPV